MFNLGSGEIALIAVAALLILGPSRLPELARGIGKFMREFRRQTDEVRGVVEREFYKMDQDIQGPAGEPQIQTRPAQDTLAQGQQPHDPHAQLHAGPAPDALPPPPEQMSSQLTAGTPPSEPVPVNEPTSEPSSATSDPAPAAPSAAPKS